MFLMLYRVKLSRLKTAISYNEAEISGFAVAEKAPSS